MRFFGIFGGAHHGIESSGAGCSDQCNSDHNDILEHRNQDVSGTIVGEKHHRPVEKKQVTSSMICPCIRGFHTESLSGLIIQPIW